MGDSPKARRSSSAPSLTDSGDLPPPRILLVTDSWKACCGTNLSFTMGPRLTLDESRHSSGGEIGPDISDMLDHVRAESPKYSMLPRPRNEPPRGAWVPAPGDYKNPGTMEKSHPTLKVSGRGWHWGSSKRNSFGNLNTYTPCSTKYNKQCADKVLPEEPAWTMSSRLDNQNPLYASRKNQAELQNVSNMLAKGGNKNSPNWSFNKRPENMWAKKTGVPGPGAYKGAAGVQVMKQSPSWGFSSASRWAKDPPPSAY